ncbi:hypothetical protein BIV57_07855 [Mangrovactinospora gilvigrisea]|uniref:F5/8 type C domain-containing protein n=1 Tax=Mangrovactinospora gilvigrisea TaxID=1428644 RepID=A0A1J7CED3_9ACTN|nr:discoidin domain-containing protein [Mangrovactinospora gilvigrisea]OIV38042.1 hypothetical protein BIV57_07855 [Mangrovactinospora gilvigrisea]
MRTRPRPATRALLATALAAGGLLTAAAAPAHAAGSAPNGYSNYAFPSGTPLTSLQSSTTITADPGPNSHEYWATQFTLGNGHTGYYGFQTNGDGRRMFLFSIWGAASSLTSRDQGAWCEQATEGTPYVGCRIHFNWRQGLTYAFDMRPVGAKGLRVTVREVQTGKVFSLGTIRPDDDPSGWTVKPSSVVNWSEFYQRNSSSVNTSCDDFFHTTVRFGLPTANDGTVRAGLAGTRAECTGNSVVTADATGTTQDLAIGSAPDGAVGTHVDVALNRPISASSSLDADHAPWLADDWRSGSDWKSAPSAGDQSVTVRLDPRDTVRRLRAWWGPDQPTVPYDLRISKDGVHWSTVASGTSAAAAEDEHALAGPVRARWLRLVMHGDGVAQRVDDLAELQAFTQ